MHQRGLDADELFRLVKHAHDAVDRLSIELHYWSCQSGVGKHRPQHLSVGARTRWPLFWLGEGECRNVAAQAEPNYTIAFASFGPQNTDLFVADGDGKNARPLVPHADTDYNASYSSDGEWIIFTSHRKGSADIYRVHPDGTGLEWLTDDPAFDDQAALPRDGKRLVFNRLVASFATARKAPREEHHRHCAWMILY